MIFRFNGGSNRYRNCEVNPEEFVNAANRQQKQTKKELTKHQILVSSVGGSRRIRTIDLPGMNRTL